MQEAQQVGPSSGGHRRTQCRAGLPSEARHPALRLGQRPSGGVEGAGCAGQEDLQDEGRTHCADGDTPATSLGPGCPPTVIRSPLSHPTLSRDNNHKEFSFYM